ncbi:hypothetical protein PR048_001595 [Dryococelus australis]|uniref:Uncharacterized protein n=1 Tax=Dryococelus australis TaxID=614101 RepID=A0ABQ9IHS9_9NEOP|nr:hypothetical protein PR048_001595 [Dryococelus australis]
MSLEVPPSVNSDHAAALDYVDDVVSTLNELRKNTNEQNGYIYTEASEGIQSRGRNHNSVQIYIAKTPTDSPEEYFKKEIVPGCFDHSYRRLSQLIAMLQLKKNCEPVLSFIKPFCLNATSSIRSFLFGKTNGKNKATIHE